MYHVVLYLQWDAATSAFGVQVAGVFTSAESAERCRQTARIFRRGGEAAGWVIVWVRALDVLEGTAAEEAPRPLLSPCTADHWPWPSAEAKRAALGGPTVKELT